MVEKDTHTQITNLLVTYLDMFHKSLQKPHLILILQHRSVPHNMKIDNVSRKQDRSVQTDETDNRQNDFGCIVGDQISLPTGGCQEAGENIGAVQVSPPRINRFGKRRN